MKKVEVGICMGTTCFVMGSSRLQEIENFLSAEMKECVEIKGITCLGECNKKDEFSKAPYVTVDGEIIPEATIEKVIEAIERKL